MSALRTLQHPVRGSSLRRAGWLAVGSLLAVALLAPASNATQETGNNGTVKIHEGATETEPIVRNEPHVCTFHLHFFFADPFQAGSWEIQEWSPGDKGTVVLAGTYDTAGDGEDRQPAEGAYELPDGHYKLFWDGDTDKHDKMKVFWVDCDETTTTTSSTQTISETSTTETTTTGTTTTETTTTTTDTTTTDTTSTASTTDTTSTDTTSTASTSTDTTTPQQSVLAETDMPATGGGPSVTLPPTDGVAGTQPDSDGWRAMLIALAALLALTLVLTPARPASRSEARRW